MRSKESGRLAGLFHLDSRSTATQEAFPSEILIGRRSPRTEISRECQTQQPVSLAIASTWAETIAIFFNNAGVEQKPFLW